MHTKSLLPVLLIPTAIVSIPAAAMFFKAEGWAWSGSDFVIAWVLIAGVLLAYKLLTRDAARTYRLAAGVALAAGLGLFWVNGAVGLIGRDDNPANLMYVGVLAVGIIGALLARFEAPGMSRALFVTAAAQFLVPIIALLVRPEDFSPGVAPVFGLNFFFVLLFAAAALLFRTSGDNPRRPGVHVPA